VEAADGTTALHRAAARDDVAFVELLLDRGASVDVEDSDGREPLFKASSAAMVAALCDAGADPDASGPDRKTALTRASKASLADTVRELLARGADVDAVDAFDGTALHWAAVAEPCEQCDETLEMLIAAGAGIDEQTNQGATPLAMAASRGRSDAVKTLIAAGADVDIGDDDGDTPITLALKHAPNDRVAVCELLLSAGASVTRANDAGESAVSLSEQAGVPDDLREIIRAKSVPAGEEDA